MIGLDTNIILRAILNDDVVQSPQAQACLISLSEQRKGFISLGVILEIYWVLDHRYKLSKDLICQTFKQLLRVEWLEFDSFDALVRALDLYKIGKIDLSDALIAEQNLQRGCAFTLTFDKSAAKHIPSMELLT